MAKGSNSKNIIRRHNRKSLKGNSGFLGVPPKTSRPIFFKIFGTFLLLGLSPLIIFLFITVANLNSDLSDLEEKISSNETLNIQQDTANIRYDMRIKFGFGVIIFLIFNIISMYLVSRFVVKPLGLIMSGMQRLGEGEYGASIRVQTRDEFMVFAYFFNLMSSRLKMHRNREKWIIKAKSRLLGLAAHQLRTPLTAIQWIFTEVIGGSYDPITSTQKEVLEKGERSVKRMINLINSLLTLTRIEEGKFDFSFDKASIVPIIEEVIEEITPQAKNKHIQLEFKGNAKEIPDVYLDKQKIKFVLENILTNAVRYTYDGGNIFVSVHIRMNQKGKKEVVISVKDTGIGMTVSEMEKLFTEFARSMEAAEMYIEGSGLGLFISKNIVIGHQGEIWAESEKGKGSTFFFSLPVRDKLVQENLYSEQFILGK